MIQQTATACWNNRVRYLGLQDKNGTIKTNDNISSWSTSAMIWRDGRAVPVFSVIYFSYHCIPCANRYRSSEHRSRQRLKGCKTSGRNSHPGIGIYAIEYHLPQITYLTYLDKIYYLVYAYSIMSLMTSILSTKI